MNFANLIEQIISKLPGANSLINKLAEQITANALDTCGSFQFTSHCHDNCVWNGTNYTCQTKGTYYWYSGNKRHVDSTWAQTTYQATKQTCSSTCTPA